jgi:hypothetical protein
MRFVIHSLTSLYVNVNVNFVQAASSGQGGEGAA